MSGSAQNEGVLVTDPEAPGAPDGARPKNRGVGTLIVRVITGSLMLPLLWINVMVVPAVAFRTVTVALLGIACWECYSILDARGARSFRWLGLLGCLAVIGSFTGIVAFSDIRPALLAVGLLAPLLAMRRQDEPEALLESTLKTVFPMAFAALPLGYLMGIYGLPGGGGGRLLIFLYLCIVLSDTLAFFVGRTWGRRPLAPRLSPKKTWEGALAGLVGSILGALLAYFWILDELTLGHTLLLGGLIGVAGILGDLAESLLKRAYGVKDSSHLLPGHGGLLDRMDSQLLAAPLLFYYYTLVILGNS
jgi:phosphatidate cytidylyltransferase